MDEEKIDVNIGEITPDAASTSNETPEEVQVPETEVATEAEDTQIDTGESKKGAEQRIRELNSQKKAAEARAQSLSERLAELTNPVGTGVQNAPYVPQVQDGQEISAEQYQSDITRTADALVEMKIKQNNAINRINNESSEVIRKYPQLDPDSSEFNPKLSNAITKATEAQVRANPYSASVKDIVDEMMEPYLGSINKEVGKVTENIARQVSETALRPTSIRKGEKTAAEKSIAELEAELGIVQS